MVNRTSPAEPTFEDLTIRAARAEDVAAIVGLIAANPVSAERERLGTPLHGCYGEAFERITADAGTEIVVAELAGRIVGTFQLTVVPGLARQGANRALLESLHVLPELRGRGIGARLLAFAEERARQRSCALLELTSDRRREDAHRFYTRAGYAPSHVGFKRML